jgi:solute:Na+ symporter, SSS family
VQFRITCFVVAAIGATFLAPDIPAQGNRPSVSVSDSSAAAPRSGVAHLQLESERALAASQPVDLLRIGEQIVLLSGGHASVLAAGGQVRPIAGGRELRDFGFAHDARFAYVVGGVASNRPSAGVWRVGLGPKGLEWTRVAALPAPCANPAAVIMGGDLFAAGQTDPGLAFFVRNTTSSGTVQKLEPPAHFNEAKSLGTQGDALYLAGYDTNGAQRLWRRKNGAWVPASQPPEMLLALSPIPVGQSHLLYLTASKTTPVLAYHTITDTWSPLPAAEGETVAMVPCKNRVMRVVKAEGDGLALRAETVVHPKRGLTLLDYAMLTGYFGLNLGIGFLCAKRKTSSDEFFRGSGRIQWWALGISYMATGMSSISFMAYPAMAYGSNWLLIGVPVFQSAAVVVAGFLFIGMFRRLNITTVFEYLEQRFGRGIRLLGAALMILSQVGGRLSIVMLLPSMAFSAVTGLNVYVSVLLMGVVTLVYCLKGGMKAVVWTDVLQFALMYGTIAIALATITHDVPGGFGGLLSVAHAEGKFKSFLFDWDFVRPTVWVFSCLAVTTVFLQLSDQALMQRALSAPDEKAARNSVMLAGVLNLPISLMLFFIGTALFVFYRHRPGLLDPVLPNDSIFPYFVGNELPRGIVGLIVAGIFAAAMSTVSGTVNAISAIAVRDFLMPFRPDSSEPTRMRLARATTVAVGGLATAIATVMAGMNIQSLWETFAALMALIGGGFPGIFALGLLTRRSNAHGVAIGLLASIGVTFAVKHYTATNVFLFTSVAVGSCMVVGYAASLLFAPPPRSLDGLTIYTLRGARKAEPQG